MFEMWFNYFAKDDSIPFYIQFGIHEKYMFPHEHVDFYELVLVTDGTAEHIVGDERFTIGKGDVLVMNVGSSHAYENACGLHICNIMFRPDMLFTYENEFRGINGFNALFRADDRKPFEGCIHLSPKDYEEIRELVCRLENEYTGSNCGRNALIHSYFTQIIVYISRLYGLPVKKREIESITRAAEYIEEHYMEDCVVKEAIAVSNYSRRHFSRLFSEVYGMSPQDYLLDTRIRHAAGYLRNSGLSIAETAVKCGFSDSGYFSRVFKKRYGVLPSRYRSGNDK